MKQLPVQHKGKVVAHATIDDDLFERFSAFKWTFDPTNKGCYRELKDPHTRLYLHREAFGSAPGDGQTLMMLDGNKLNCVRSNIQAGHKRNNAHLLRGPNGKSFPNKEESFVNYLNKHYPDFQELLDEGSIVEYGRRRIVLSYEDGESAKRARHHSFRMALLEKLRDDFGFAGDVQIVERLAPEKITAAAPAAAPAEPAAAPPPPVVAPAANIAQFAMLTDTVAAFTAGRINNVQMGFVIGGETIAVSLSRTPAP